MILMVLSTIGLSARLAMEPQNKVHFGASLISSSHGFSIGMDSRLTQLIYVDIGGFASLNNTDSFEVDEEDPKSYVIARHALYAMPGWRIPHRYKEDKWNWDVFIRAGFGCMFSKDLSIDVINTDPAVLAGLEGTLRKDNVGVRFMVKEFYFKPYVTESRQEEIYFSEQYSTEFFIQF
jgi:hypothetical protein